MSINEKAKEFDSSGKYRRKADEVLKRLRQFRRKYPFKEHPELIDNLTAEDIYEPGKDYFFKWIVYRLKDLAHVKCFPSVFQNARDNLEEFRSLMRIAIDDTKSLAEKVDAPWGNIKRMGGDKHLAKKIICCYYDDTLPILRTADLEFFYKLLVNQKIPATYYGMSTGKKFQFLNQALLDAKESLAEVETWDNAYFMWFLYVSYRGLT